MKDHKNSHLVEYVFSNTKRHVFHFILSVISSTLDHFVIRSGAVLTHVFAIQIFMVRSYIRQKKMDLGDTLRFVFVSIISYVSIDFLTNSRDIHPIATALAIPNIYWFSDTIVFNTALNVYALAVFSISSYLGLFSDKLEC